MLSSRTAKAVTLLLSLLIVTAGYCAPTVTVDRPAAAFCVTSASDYVDTSATTADVTQLPQIYNSQLTNIADELLKPPPAFTSSAASMPAGATSLPPVPGALFMGLTGFLCVSLARDRKFWTAALVGLLWAGQAGKQMLVSRFSQLLEHRVSSIEQLTPAPTYNLQDIDRLRSDIEGTRYIGLLHHLAGIPTAEERPHVQRRAKPVSSRVERYLAPPFRRGFAPSTSIEYLVSSIHTICEVTKRLVRVTKWHAYFSPAFTFENLPRGPPLLA